MTVEQRKGPNVVVDEDEEFKRIDYEKVSLLKPAFRKASGTVTAANSSTINDGASAVLLMSQSEAMGKGIMPLAEILAYADAETDPKEFTIAPSLAIPLALERAGVSKDQVDLWEINEAFSVVVLANEKALTFIHSFTRSRSSAWIQARSMWRVGECHWDIQ